MSGRRVGGGGRLSRGMGRACGLRRKLAPANSRILRSRSKATGIKKTYGWG